MSKNKSKPTKPTSSKVPPMSTEEQTPPVETSQQQDETLDQADTAGETTPDSGVAESVDRTDESTDGADTQGETGAFEEDSATEEQGKDLNGTGASSTDEEAPLEAPVITPEPEITPEPTIEEPPVITPVVTEESTESTLVSYINRTIDSYIEAMKPGKPCTLIEVGQNHSRLLEVLKRILSEDGAAFVTGLELLLKRLGEHRDPDGVFHENYLFRGLDKAETGLSRGNSRFYAQVFGLLGRLSSPGARALTLAQYDLTKGLSEVPNDAWRNKLIEYFTAGQ